MKLVRFAEPGRDAPGLIARDGHPHQLSSLVTDLTPEKIAPQRIGAVEPHSLAVVRRTPRLGPPLKTARKFIGVRLNYSGHAAESKCPSRRSRRCS